MSRSVTGRNNGQRRKSNSSTSQARRSGASSARGGRGRGGNRGRGSRSQTASSRNGAEQRGRSLSRQLSRGRSPSNASQESRDSNRVQDEDFDDWNMSEAEGDDEGDTTTLAGIARMVGRRCTMFGNIALIFNEGLQYPNIDDVDPKIVTAETLDRLKDYYRIVELIPTLPDTLQKFGPKGMAVSISTANTSRNRARASDLCGMKKAAPNFPGGGGLPTFNSYSHRHLCGFQSDTTGRAICPASLDFDDPEIKKGLKDGTIKVYARQIPRFFFPNCTPDPENPLKGFCKSRWILKALLFIFVSPSAATDEGEENLSKRKGNAAIHGITDVNIHMIAYAATILRFVLSDQMVFSAGGQPGKWPYRRFYKHVIARLEDLPKEVLDDILEYYQEKLFGDLETSSNGSLDLNGPAHAFEKAFDEQIKSKKATEGARLLDQSVAGAVAVAGTAGRET